MSERPVTLGYAFCEPSWATTSSREHIREVLDGLRLGGGITEPALCGADLAGGWDLITPVNTERVRRGLSAECNPTCRDCADLWLAADTPTP